MDKVPGMLKAKDREQFLHNFLTQVMGELDRVRLGLEMILEDKNFFKSKAVKISRKKKILTK